MEAFVAAFCTFGSKCHFVAKVNLGQELAGPEPPGSTQRHGLKQPGVGVPGRKGAPGQCQEDLQEEENDPLM